MVKRVNYTGENRQAFCPIQPYLIWCLSGVNNHRIAARATAAYAAITRVYPMFLVAAAIAPGFLPTSTLAIRCTSLRC